MKEYKDGIFLDGALSYYASVAQYTGEKTETEIKEDIKQEAETLFDSYIKTFRDFSDVTKKYGSGNMALRAASFIDGYIYAVAFKEMAMHEE